MSADDHYETRQERRERKQVAKRERMQQHGAGLRRNLTNSALNMARRLVKKSKRGR